MNVFTHNTADDHTPMTFVKFIRTEATLEQLQNATGNYDDWFAVDLNGDDVDDHEMLCGEPYPKTEGTSQVRAQNINVDGEAVRVEMWGRL